MPFCDVRPGVGVPFRVAFEVEERTAELVRAALGHARNLQPARTAVFGLVGRREHSHLGNRVHVELNALAVAARINVGHAVEQEVRGASSKTCDGGVRAGRRDGATTPGTSAANEAKLRPAFGRFSTCVCATVNDRSPVWDWIIGASPETSTVSASAPTSRLSCRDHHAIAGTDGDAPALGRLEAVHRDSDPCRCRR